MPIFESQYDLEQGGQRPNFYILIDDMYMYDIYHPYDGVHLYASTRPKCGEITKFDIWKATTGLIVEGQRNKIGSHALNM